MRWPGFLAILAFLMAFACLWVESDRGNIIFINSEVKPFDVATLALVAATLVVTGVAVISALIALWGYDGIKKAVTQSIKEQVVEIAAKEARASARSVVIRYLLEHPRLGLDTSAEDAARIVDNLDDGKSQ